MAQSFGRAQRDVPGGCSGEDGAAVATPGPGEYYCGADGAGLDARRAAVGGSGGAEELRRLAICHRKGSCRAALAG